MFKVDGLRRKLWAVILAGEQRARHMHKGRRKGERGAGQNGGSCNLPRCNLAGEAYSYLAGFNIVHMIHVALVAAAGFSFPRFPAA